MKIVECSRDAMQGLTHFIPTEQKIDYLQSLLNVGFDTIDCGSFVSPKMIPQMRDTAEVLKGVDTSRSTSKLSVIVANESGAKRALDQEKVAILGYPFSLSNTFQLRNTNRTREEAVQTIYEIQKLTENTNKELLLYYSMAFGNPYGDEWKLNDFQYFTEIFNEMGIKYISISDTIGVADIAQIKLLFSTLIPEFPQIEFGAHFHTVYNDWKPKVVAAFETGCNKFDGAIKGFGGCPMAKDELVGNMPTEKLLTFAEEFKLPTQIDSLAFESAYNESLKVLH